MFTRIDKSAINRLPFSAETFEPHLLFRNSHVQTLAGEYFRPKKGLEFRRVRLDTPDGDFVDLDFPEISNYTWKDLGEKAPILYFLHGLEGDARRGYAQDLYKGAAKAGFRAVGLNYRSCSGEMNRNPRFYHMGATDDVGFVHQWLLKEFPDAPMVMVGVSLGGNILLKYLGECGDALPERVVAGAAISPPFVATGHQPLSDEALGRIYGRHLLKRLQAKVRQKAEMLRETKAKPDAALAAKTLRDFDNAITAPLHGFKDASDYYAQSNSINFVADIRRPTLVIRSKDDPFFNADIPYEKIDANPYLYSAFPEYGGHVGFIEGTTPFNYQNWAQRQVLRFFEMILEERA
jgi:predicted alpha/beta-fold hydrolase